MARRVLTLGYSSHRVEVLARAEPWMRAHDAVVLEEPPLPGFAEMLAGTRSVDDYVDDSGFEFPLFARRSCTLLRALHRDGIAVRQVEPFLDTLAEVHDRFAAGERPEDLADGTPWRAVYDAERAWTEALMRYYWVAGDRPFDDVVAAVVEFARADGARGQLRDAMRADALLPLLDRHDRIYVEAGYLHLPLRSQLRPRLPDDVALAVVYPMEAEARALHGRPRLLSPGDRLTLRLAFQPGFDGHAAALLAARSIVHLKLEAKEEWDDDGRAPHLRDEAETIALVSDLGYDACRALYDEIRHLEPPDARARVRARRPA